MNYFTFKDQFFPLVSFSTHQVYALYPDFNKNNLTNWSKKGYIIKLKNGLYTFPEYKQEPFYALYFANRMYRPSYISTHSALAFYGLIPEAVVQITSVSSLKTAEFENPFGTYVYQNIRPALMFGFEGKSNQRGLNILLAHPEKAMLDLLYLHPYYKTMQDFEDLRMDEEVMEEIIIRDRILSYLHEFQNNRMEKIIEGLLQTFKK